MKAGQHGCETAVPKESSEQVPVYRDITEMANHSHRCSIKASRKSGSITKAAYWSAANNSIYLIMQTAGPRSIFRCSFNQDRF